ncbi:MAG: ABC-2 type transport system permease protein [Saprospiraceae bacterium]|jgi:ABC-2 type transport system permease protein
MNKLILIIKREFLSRIKKPSFLLMCLFTPFLFASLVLAPIAINKSNFSETTVKVFDETNIIGRILIKHNQNKFVKYELQNSNDILEDAIDKYDKQDDVMVLRIPSNFIKNQSPAVELFNNNSPGIYLIGKVKNDLFDIRKKLLVYSTFKLDLQEFEQKMNSPVAVIFQGRGLNPQLKFFLGFSISLLLYMLIIMYGVQVMRGVMEEKNSRIIEVLISSVQPKTLLKGKIIGIGLVGILQFTLIISFSIALLAAFNTMFEVDTSLFIQNQLQMLGDTGMTNKINVTQAPLFNQQVQTYMNAISNYLPVLLLVTPVLFFLGYYLYASLFAAVGSALDHDTDTQQFVLPITIPLIISGSIAFNILDNPNSNLAFWASLFPLSSPIVMTARLAFMNIATDWWQIALSVGILIITIMVVMKISGRIYRVGILMHGQKVSYKTLWKWFKSKN